MEKMLSELLAVNREILSEIRLLRQALADQARSGQVHPGQGRVLAGQAPQPQSYQASEVLEEPAIFQDAQRPKAAPPRFTPEDLEDMHGTLVSGITRRNRDKSNAFEQFEKRHKDW